MDLGRAFGYPTQDDNWIVKLIIGAVISLIPIVNFIALGFTVRATGEVMRGNENKLPEWDDFNGDFMRGAMVFVGNIIYMLPMLLIVCCLGLLSLVAESVAILMFCCMSFIMMGYVLLILPLLLAAQVRYAATEDFSVYLDFAGRFNEVRSHITDLITFVIMVFAAQVIIGVLVSLTAWICGLGFVVFFGGQLIVAHLIAQYGIAIGVSTARPPVENAEF